MSPPNHLYLGLILAINCQAVLVCAQEPASTTRSSNEITSLVIPTAKIIAGAERTIILTDGTKIQIPEQLWKPGQHLNTKHGPVQLPASLGNAAPKRSNDPQPEKKSSETTNDRPQEKRGDGPPPKGERQRFRFEMPEPTPAQGNRDPASPAQEGSKALKQQPQASSKSAATWKPRGIVSMRNQLQFNPAPDGTLRTGRNANIRGDNGEMAASSQTRALRSIQGMPEYLRVYFDAKTNGFYIDVVRQ